MASQRAVLRRHFSGCGEALSEPGEGSLRGLCRHLGGCKILLSVPALPNRYNLDDFREKNGHVCVFPQVQFDFCSVGLNDWQRPEPISTPIEILRHGDEAQKTCYP
jgi:hypothetical protein